eukprot:2362627-Prymnesium_polylepis.1
MHQCPHSCRVSAGAIAHGRTAEFGARATTAARCRAAAGGRVCGVRERPHLAWRSSRAVAAGRVGRTWSVVIACALALRPTDSDAARGGRPQGGGCALVGHARCHPTPHQPPAMPPHPTSHQLCHHTAAFATPRGCAASRRM